MHAYNTSDVFIKTRERARVTIFLLHSALLYNNAIYIHTYACMYEYSATDSRLETRMPEY